MARFRDVETEIRLNCITIAQQLLKHSVEHSVVTDLQQKLAEILYDQDPEVRYTAVTAIAHLANHDVRKICCPELVKAFASRTGDVYRTLRTQSITAVGQVYSRMMEINHPNIIKMSHVFKTAGSVLWRYKSSTDQEELTIMERSFSQYLVDDFCNDASIKAMKILNLVIHSSEKVIEAMSHLLKKQFWFRTDIVLILKMLQDGRVSSDTTLNSKMKSLVNKFRHYDSPGMHLHSIFNHEMRPEIMDKLVAFFSCELSLPDALEVADDFTDGNHSSHSSSTSTADDIKNDIIVRSGVLLVDSQVIAKILQMIQIAHDSYTVRLASFLTLLSNIHEHLFTSDEVADLLLDLPGELKGLLSSESLKDHFKIEETTRDRMKQSYFLFRELFVRSSPTPSRSLNESGATEPMDRSLNETSGESVLRSSSSRAPDDDEDFSLVF